jgi:hypothetical protein
MSIIGWLKSIGDFQHGSPLHDATEAQREELHGVEVSCMIMSSNLFTRACRCPKGHPAGMVICHAKPSRQALHWFMKLVLHGYK